MEKVLINVSNHPSNLWAEEQKRGWDEIIDVPFPAVDPSIETSQVIDLLNPIMERLGEIRSSQKELYINFQGEYTLTYLFARLFFEVLKNDGWTLVVPTTKRTVVEEDNIKKSIFQFIQWRVL